MLLLYTEGLPGVSTGRMPMSYVYAGSITFDYIDYINEAWWISFDCVCRHSVVYHCGVKPMPCTPMGNTVFMHVANPQCIKFWQKCFCMTSVWDVMNYSIFSVIWQFTQLSLTCRDPTLAYSMSGKGLSKAIIVSDNGLALGWVHEKPLFEYMLTYCQMDSWKQISMKVYSKYIHFRAR